jgi:inosine-uridine nucleoside N-ribohydrolase
MENLAENKENLPAVHLHDPLAVYYAFASELPGWKVNRGQDIRVETQGVWTKGATIVDKRGRSKLPEKSEYDEGLWRYENAGNRVDICLQSPLQGVEFGKRLLDTIFDYEEI